MIAIVNIGPITKDPQGVQNYELRINREPVARFQHTRSDPLDVLLEKAAQAYRREEIEKTTRLFASANPHLYVRKPPPAYTTKTTNE